MEIQPSKVSLSLMLKKYTKAKKINGVMHSFCLPIFVDSSCLKKNIFFARRSPRRSGRSCCATGRSTAAAHGTGPSAPGRQFPGIPGIAMAWSVLWALAWDVSAVEEGNPSDSDEAPRPG